MGMIVEHGQTIQETSRRKPFSSATVEAEAQAIYQIVSGSVCIIPMLAIVADAVVIMQIGYRLMSRWVGFTKTFSTLDLV